MSRPSLFFAIASIAVLSMLIAAADPASEAADPSQAPHAGDIDLTGYTLTFEDDFDHLSLATRSPKGSATWLHIPPYGAAANYSASTWDANALSVSDGILSIKAFKDADGTWRSGNLSSMDETGQGFAQRYGYFEVRARMPASGTGSWPAFWLMSSTSINNTAGKKFSEIDIFEWYGKTYTDNRAVISEATHNWAAGAARRRGGILVAHHADTRRREAVEGVPHLRLPDRPGAHYLVHRRHSDQPDPHRTSRRIYDGALLHDARLRVRRRLADRQGGQPFQLRYRLGPRLCVTGVGGQVRVTGARPTPHAMHVTAVDTSANTRPI